MLAIYGTALLYIVASAVAGRALLHLFGWRRPTWLVGAIGFAVLAVACPILIRLPGRATTAGVIVGIALLAALPLSRPPRRDDQGEADGARTPVSRARRLLSRRGRMRPRRGEGRGAGDTGGRATHLSGLAVVVIVLAVASLPFLFNQRTGVLGEGIYTNDQAAQLYWTDWLQHGLGPEPSAVRFGYPVGPQSVAAVAAQATGASLEDAFNGLLLAIAVLTALAALAALEDLPPIRRTIAASLAGLPYLAASFLAQSAFKETAMAMLVLALAVTCRELSRGAPRRAGIAALAVIAAGSVVTYSLPGLVWMAIAFPVWAALEFLFGRWRIDWATARAATRRHWRAIAAAAIVVVALAAAVAGPVSHFTSKVGQVQASAGRLASPVFEGEALGVWPEGDFRVVRGDVSGAIPATLLGLLAVGLGALIALRRRELALASTLGAAVAVYVGARALNSIDPGASSIYVQAKALAILAPIATLVTLKSLLSASRGGGQGVPPSEASEPQGPHAAPSRRGLREGEYRGPHPTNPSEPQTAHAPSSRRRVREDGYRVGRLTLGVLFTAAAIYSTFLALRAAPVGFDQRGQQLESLAARIQGRSVVFLGVDRFGAYWLRGTLVRSPGGYVPPTIGARPEKVWLQGQPMDLDTLMPNRLDQFDYAITTSAAYQSSSLPSFRKVAETDSFILWERTGSTPRDKILNEDGDPGKALDCSTAEGRTLASRKGTATVLPQPVKGSPAGWSRSSPFTAPADAVQTLRLPPGSWNLSLQYHSQVALTVRGADGQALATLPPSLDGMYLSDLVPAPHEGQDSYWPAGKLTVRGSKPTTITVSAAEPTGLQRALGVKRQVWLGAIAATRRPLKTTTVPLSRACGRYVDRYTLG